MALRFIESFDHYTSAAAFDAKWGLDHNYSLAPTASGGRFNQGIYNWRLDDYFGKTFDAQATWIVGFAARFTQAPNGSSTLCTVTDANSLQTELRVLPTGVLQLATNGTVLATGTTLLKTGVFYYIEWKVTISNTVGVSACRINGVSELSLTNQDTQTTGNATANRVLWGFYGTGTSTVSYDDIYICDGTGSAPTNDFLGDVRIEALMPSGNGNSSVLVGSDGNSTDNYLLVDEADPNGDTDYVESSSVGDKDTYTFGNLTSTAGTVYGVQVIPWARKTDAGTRNIASIARLSGTEVDSANKLLSTNYQYLPDIRETKPGGGVWSITDVNNAEFGAKVTA